METQAQMIWCQFFSTAKVKNPIINNINDKKIVNFDKALHSVLLNLSKRIVADGEGASQNL